MRAGLLVALALALEACAQRGGAALALPSSWDETRFEAVLAGAHGKAVIAVLPFEAAPAAWRGEVRIGDMVTTALSATHRVELVEREKIEHVLGEQRLRLSGAVDDASRAAEVGKLLGAEAVVFGAITSATQETVDKFAYDLVRTQVRIDARAVDTTTGRILFSQSGDGLSEAKIIRSADGTLISGLRNAEDEYRKAAEAAAATLGRGMARQFPVMGLVLSTVSGRIVTDLGAESGIAMGDEVLAVRPGEVLLNPVTRQPAGRDARVLDVLLVTEVRQGSAVLLRDGLSAELLRAGDVVVLSGEREQR